MSRRMITFAFCSALLPISGVWAGSDINYLDPPQGLFNEQWMVMKLTDEKVGYLHTTLSRDGDVVTTRTVTVMRIARANKVAEVLILNTTDETVEGVPRSFESVAKMGLTSMRTRGYIEDGTVHITTTQFGADTEREAPFPKGAKMAWGMFREQIEKGFAPGTSYQIDVYEPQFDTTSALRASVTVGEHTEIEVLGKKREAIELTVTMHVGPGQIETTSYVDRHGIPLKAEVTMMAGMPITMLAADRKTALADFEPPELFLNTLVEVGRPIDTEKARKIRYTLKLSGEGRKLPELPETVMQRVLEQSALKAELVVKRINREPLKDATMPSEPPTKLAEFLKATATLNIDDDAVKKMAAEAAGDEKRPYHLADRLRRYVSEKIEDKNLNVGFATASEVCRELQGDCTEHAVLLAALGRARGLPSRVVVGLVYVPEMGGARHVFGFHMWTQFYIEGQWIDFDAAMNESDVSPAHIALGTSSLEDVGLGDLVFAVIDVITGLEIQIEEVQPPDRTEADVAGPSGSEGEQKEGEGDKGAGEAPAEPHTGPE